MITEATIVAYEFESDNEFIGEMACPACYAAYYSESFATPRTQADIHNFQEGEYITCEGCGYPLDPQYEIDHGAWDPKPRRAS
jgi:hypothetical protein